MDIDLARLNTLQDILCLRIEELLCALDVSIQRRRKMFYGCCPVHGGNNPGALNLYHDGKDRAGLWRCNTRHCEQVFKKTIIGFVRGVLSHQKYNWDGKGREVNFNEAINWCCNFIGKKFSDLDADDSNLEKLKFTRGMDSFSISNYNKQEGLARELVRSRLEIPAKYFIDRGFSAKILDCYDIGLCLDPDKPFCGRAVVPIYDNDHQVAIGFTGRSIYDRCDKCFLWHAPWVGCPKTDRERFLASKWINSEGFPHERILFNYWFAKKIIQETRTVVLVEGAMDALKLVEAGILGVVGLLGSSLTEGQQCQLELSGALNVVILTDMDEPGRRAAKEIDGTLGRSFRVTSPAYNDKDLGDMSVEDIKEKILPEINRLVN